MGSIAAVSFICLLFSLWDVLAGDLKIPQVVVVVIVDVVVVVDVAVIVVVVIVDDVFVVDDVVVVVVVVPLNGAATVPAGWPSVQALGLPHSLPGAQWVWGALPTLLHQEMSV